MTAIKINLHDIEAVKTFIKSQVFENPITECWEWQGKQQPVPNSDIGYGVIYGRVKKRFNTGLVHRISYQLFNGPVTKDILVRHKCDNKICCNPRHLELGTNLQNQSDRRKSLEECSIAALVSRELLIKHKIKKLEEQLGNIQAEMEKRLI